MRTFIIANDGQYTPGDMPTMKVVKLKDFRKLMMYMGFLYEDKEYDGEEIPTNNDLIKEFNTANGDGSAFWLVKELVEGKVVAVKELKKT